jgi:hypothetical protein
VLLLVVPADDREGVHDVVDVGAGNAVEVEDGGVEFAANVTSTLLIPGILLTAKDRACYQCSAALT